MGIAAEVRRGRTRKPGSVRPEQFRVKFGVRGRPGDLTPERAAAYSKAKWGAALGVPVPKTADPPPETGG